MVWVMDSKCHDFFVHAKGVTQVIGGQGNLTPASEASGRHFNGTRATLGRVQHIAGKS